MLFFNSRKKSMHWFEEHNIMLVRECLLFESWKYKSDSPERGNIWKRISEVLNALEHPAFIVTDRSCRDHLNLLITKFKKIDNKNEKASGIEVNEETELEKGLCDIIELFNDQERITKEESQAKKKKMEEEAAKAQKFRLMSLETFGQTQKRASESSEEDSPTSSKTLFPISKRSLL